METGIIEEKGGLYIIDTNGENLWRLTTPPHIQSMPLADWSPNGYKILYWDIYRFRLSDGKVTQLTDSPDTDYAAHEWNPRLPVAPQELAPKRWGEIKGTATGGHRPYRE